jgi:hypothetical protein
MPEKNEQPVNEQKSELQKAVDKRRDWFYECQLRSFNLQAFRDLLANSEEKWLDLISEKVNSTAAANNGQKEQRVYLDSRQPVWTQEDKDQREKFAEGFIGKLSNWLDLKKPSRLVEKIAEMRKKLEDSTFFSSSEKLGRLDQFDRKDQIKDDNNLPHILSRMAISQNKPWLIPELFHTPHTDTRLLKDWLHNAEDFIRMYHNELMLFQGKAIEEAPPFDMQNTAAYRQAMQEHLRTTIQAAGANSVMVSFFEYSEKDKKNTYDLYLMTPGSAKKKLWEFPHSEIVKRWGYAFNMKGLYLNLANSDMGLCLLMRALYLYGRLPASFEKHALFTWRNRIVPTEQFDQFIGTKFNKTGNDIELLQRINKVSAQFKVLLELNAANPCSADIRYSLLSESFFKHAIQGFKFWIDEEYRMNDHNPSLLQKVGYLATIQHIPDVESGLNRARKNFDEEKHVNEEMEYWSENHYIMFASSEYLAGQLWPEDTFQPVKDFLSIGNTGKLTGAARKERGKARVMKWLDNRLRFGWSEYNSSGYYREHLWALLNLVDFALDKDVRQKATIVTDLLLFDIVRFMHKGTMGACGGRSQFKFKNSGWEGGLSDVIEIMFGNKGLFTDSSGEIGFAFASSTYKIPDVLLEIGHHPPAGSFIDRSRVSITFEEAGKYGIQTSKKSDQQDALMEGYREKRIKHFKPVMDVYNEIARTHRGYGQKEEDTIFWWSLSAYYNKQIVRNSLECREKFGLEATGVFKGMLPFIFNVLMPLLHRASNTSLGSLAGSVIKQPMWGSVAGYFASDVFGTELEESGADDLSIFIEGSTRTRANIYTYRDRDVMLSSIQNFRAGQCNFQSQVNQATISHEISVFITSFFGGFNISDLAVGVAGSLPGVGLGVSIFGIVGAIVADIGYQLGLDEKNPLGDETDGPSWWTGNWSLPMIVQYKNAAILAFDTHFIQRRLADHGSHAWFPKNAFTETDEKRCASYKDTNFFLEDTFDIGPKGFWHFGKLIHGTDPKTGLPEEAYIGLFSNRRLKWMDKDEDFYKEKLDDEELKVDFFADRELYKDKNNIWIMHVGSSADFGSFDNFKEQLSKAKVEIDDAGDFECTYHMPDGKGHTDTLKLDYDDGGNFTLNNQGYHMDLYPRFENPFIRRGMAAWGQLEWVIEYNGKSLLHNFSNWNDLVRQEDVPATPGQMNTIRGLVLYIRTGDEEMEQYSVAKATVHIGCTTVATDEVIAVGEVGEGKWHDAEWIYFDKEVVLSPDMTITIEHPKITKTGEDEPEWAMGFTMKALLGDHALWDCALSVDGFHFEDEKRNTGPLPFSVTQSKWHVWISMDDRSFSFFHIASQPGYDRGYYNYIDVFGKDDHDRLWYLRYNACAADDGLWTQVADGIQLPASGEPPLCSLSFRPGHFYVFIIKKEGLFLLSKENDLSTPVLNQLDIATASETDFLGFPTPFATRVPVEIDLLSKICAIAYPEYPFGADVYITGKDGNIYAVHDWFAFSSPFWRKIDVQPDFQLNTAHNFYVWRDIIFVLDNKQQLWMGEIDRSSRNMRPDWKVINREGMHVSKFILEAFGEVCVLAAITDNGQVWTSFVQINPALWQRLGEVMNFTVFANAGLAAVISSSDRVDYLVTGADGKVYQNFRTGATAWVRESGWSVAEQPEEIFKLTPDTDLTARCRVKGQIELYAVKNNKLFKTWWS